MDTQMHEAAKHAKNIMEWYLASAYIYVSPGNDI